MGVATDDGAEAAIEAALDLLSKARHKNNELELKLQQLMRERTGRRTEKVSEDQLALALALANDDELMDDTDVDADEDVDVSANADDERPKRKAKRKKLSEELPREVHEHRVADADRCCPDCGKPMASIGFDTSEMLDFVPARFIVREHRREKVACGGCKSSVVTAPGPAKVIDKGLPSAGLLAHVLVNKYQDHLPLSRQATIF